jgi:hypothetical protein
MTLRKEKAPIRNDSGSGPFVFTLSSILVDWRKLKCQMDEEYIGNKSLDTHVI